MSPDQIKCKGSYFDNGGVRVHRWIWMARINNRMCQFCDANMDRQGNVWADERQLTLLNETA